MTNIASRGIAAIVAVLGIIILSIPKFILPVCESAYLGFISSYEPVMRCFWFGQTELILGALVFLAGLIILCRPGSEISFAVGIIVMALGLGVILVSSNAVIGSTCGHQHSLCQTGTKPAERIIGTVVIILGFITTVSNIKRSVQK